MMAPCPWIGGVRPPGLDTKKVLICGTRTFDDYPLLKEKMDLFTFWFEDVIVLSGGNRTMVYKMGEMVYIGADHYGELWAEQNWYTRLLFNAHWAKHGKKAGPLRNSDMAKELALEPRTSFVVAFWNGSSAGTRDMLQKADRVLKSSHIKVVRYKDNARARRM